MMNYLQTLKTNLENSIEANIKFQEYIKNYDLEKLLIY